MIFYVLAASVLKAWLSIKAPKSGCVVLYNFVQFILLPTCQLGIFIGFCVRFVDTVA